MSVRRAGLAVALASLLAACGQTGSGTAESGVAGLVLAGPQCPVERPGIPCPDKPIQAEIQAERAGRTVAEGRSGADGRFRLALPPGSYALTARGPAAMSCAPTQVTVRPQEFATITIECDTGIR